MMPPPEPCPVITDDHNKPVSSALWPWLTAIFAALWFATMISWNIQRTRSYNAEHKKSDTSSTWDDSNEKEAFAALEKACKDNHASQSITAIATMGVLLLA